MPLTICFMLDHKQVCFEIPQFRPNPPGVDPDPWIHGLEITKEDVGQLTQLSTIASIVETMPIESQRLFAPVVEQAVKTEAKKVPGVAFNWHRGGPGPDPATSHR